MRRVLSALRAGLPAAGLALLAMPAGPGDAADPPVTPVATGDIGRESAYHVLRPTADMKTRHGVRNEGCGRVACVPDELGVGWFAVHPAVADTPLAGR